MKIGTHVAGDSMHMWSKGHTSGLNNCSLVMPLCYLESCWKVYPWPQLIKRVQDIHMKLETHTARDNTHVCTKGHDSSIINYWVAPLFQLRKKTRQCLDLSFVSYHIDSNFIYVWFFYKEMKYDKISWGHFRIFKYSEALKLWRQLLLKC